MDEEVAIAGAIPCGYRRYPFINEYSYRDRAKKVCVSV